jgi:chemotaxis regulatin CheY-phosphate phosphatase CheZ
MSHSSKAVATATETPQKEAMLYDLFNLTEQQADKVVDAVEKSMPQFKKDGNQCDYIQRAFDALETNDEKLYASYVAGKMSSEASDPLASLFGGFN